MRQIHLISNAHIDPVWMWEWQEGAAEAISTFRVAAEFCEQYDGYVFNHNEVLLYQWVEEYEPSLFKRIQALVAQGKWHIMGGWYLQPDCNMPSGESFVRQILLGRQYFAEKFNVVPTTAIGFDAFGHSRGLVQILKKSGFDSYLFCRPQTVDLTLPNPDFIWVGYDGSEVVAHRSDEFYNSPLGKARSKIEGWIQDHPTDDPLLILWGVGNHGGGPSRIDLEAINTLIAENPALSIRHSIPEAYFDALKTRTGSDTDYTLPRFTAPLISCFVGCYTSQTRIKHRHRLLENELFMAEKMLSHAAVQAGVVYPASALHEVSEVLAMAEFHDILPGTSVKTAERSALRLMDHGLEILSKLKARAFFALAAGQRRAEPGEIPILIYNPHPYPVSGVFECEFQLADQNWNVEFSYPHIYQDGGEIPAQPEKEVSNIALDWRKRVVFQAELKPSQINRFDCRLEVLPEKPKPQIQPTDGLIRFVTETLDVTVNCKSGLIDSYKVDGVEYLKPNAFRTLAIADSDDPWSMNAKSFRDVIGAFELMSPEAGTHFSGIRSNVVLASVRVIEDGAVRTVIQSMFQYEQSYLVQTYKLPKQGSTIEVNLHILWNEAGKMLKLSVPTQFTAASYRGQTAFGVEQLSGDGSEVVAHQWTAAVSENGYVFGCINEGVYGSDFSEGEIRLSLLRSAGYAGHPILDREIMPQDRFSPRIDQGEHNFRFWFTAGREADMMPGLDRAALNYNQQPMILSFFPAGSSTLPNHRIQSLMTLSDDAIQLSAFKQAESGTGYIIRLFEPTGSARTTTLTLPWLSGRYEIAFSPFEVKTFRLNVETGSLVEVNLTEAALQT